MAKKSGGDVDDAFEAELMGDVAAVKSVDLVPVVSESISDAVPALTMSLKDALKSDKPEARVAVADHMFRSQRRRQPEVPKKLYLVDNDPEPVHAIDEVDALAVHNTRCQKSSGPFGRKVREVREEPAMA